MSPIAFDFRPQQDQDMQAATLAASSPIRNILQRLQSGGAISGLSSDTSIPPSVSASSSPVQAPTALSQWPLFANDAERNIAMATSAYNPAYASPLKMIENQVMTADANRDIGQRSTYERQMFPVLAGQSPEERQRALTAGDVSGLGLKLLRGGYNPMADRGRIDMENPTKDNLDREIYHNPDFQRLLSVHPEQAKNLYQQFKGRSLDEDITSAKAYQADRLKFSQGLLDESRKKAFEDQITATQLPTKVGRAYAEQQIKGGAIYDPTKQTWKVWNVADAPEGQGVTGFGAAPKPFRQLEDATEDQNRMLNQHYPDITGRMLPTKPKPSQLSGIRKDPQYEADIQKYETTHHRTIPDDELAALVHRITQKQSMQAEVDQQGFWGTVPKVSEDTLRAIAGRKSGAPVFSSDPSSTDPENLNWWGNYMNEALHGQVDPEGNHIIPSINAGYKYLTNDLWQEGGPVHQLFNKLGWAQTPLPIK